MESIKYSRNCEKGTSSDKNTSVSRPRDMDPSSSQGDERRFSPNIEWNRGPRRRNVENIRDHEDRNWWRDESQRFHQVPNKRRFSPDIEWNRGPRRRNVENIRDHEDRNWWRDESQRFHQVPSTSSLDRHADLDCRDVDQRENRLSDEMGISAREMCFECAKNALQKEECHRAPSPQPVQCYSDRAAARLVESLQEKDSFEEGCMVLMTWLERGDCNKKNCEQFYNLIAVFNAMYWIRLNKRYIEDELTTVQQEPHQQCACNCPLFQIVEKVFQIVSSQKVLNNFAKLQRKHLEQWVALVNAAKETSDSKDQNSPEKCAQDLVTPNENSNKEDKPDLEKETKVLRSQLQVANSELADSKKQIAALNNAYQLMQQKYLDTKLKLEEVLKEKAALEKSHY